MSFKFKLIGELSPPAADDSRSAEAMRFVADDSAHTNDAANAADDCSADDLAAGLPPELAALATQLMGESQQLAAAFPAPAAGAAKCVEDSPAGSGKRWSQTGPMRRWSGAAAAVLIAAGLWAVLGSPGNRRPPAQPAPTAAQVIEPATLQPPAVHAVIFSELSGAEQEGLLDLLSESGSIGSI